MIIIHYSSIGGEEEGIDFDEIADDVINNDEIFENVINNDVICDDGLENWYYNQEDIITKDEIEQNIEKEILFYDEDLLGINIKYIIDDILEQLSNKSYVPTDYFQPCV